MFVHSDGYDEDGEPQGSVLDIIRSGDSADRETEGSEAMDRIMEAIGSLKENHRLIITLQLEGMKPKKMAEIIGCSADAASTLLFRARKALKRELGKSFLADYGIAV